MTEEFREFAGRLCKKKKRKKTLIRMRRSSALVICVCRVKGREEGSDENRFAAFQLRLTYLPSFLPAYLPYLTLPTGERASAASLDIAAARSARFVFFGRVFRKRLPSANIIFNLRTRFERKMDGNFALADAIEKLRRNTKISTTVRRPRA